MPLPDESKAQRASDLIKRFQSQVDAAAAEEQRSITKRASPRPSWTPSSSSPKPTQKEELSDELGRVEIQEPAPGSEESGAQFQSKAESEQPIAAATSSADSSPVYIRGLPPIITSPYEEDDVAIDLFEPVPGSADLLTSPRLDAAPGPSHSRSNSLASLHSPHSRSNSLASLHSPHSRHSRSSSIASSVSTNHEGLSAPSSPAADPRRLSVPPLTNDASPPATVVGSPPRSIDGNVFLFPSGPLEQEDGSTGSPPPLAEEDSATHQTDIDQRDQSHQKPSDPDRSASILSTSVNPKVQPQRQRPASNPKMAASHTRAPHSLSSPTASSLAKAKHKPTDSVSSTQSASSPSTSPSRIRTRTTADRNRARSISPLDQRKVPPPGPSTPTIAAKRSPVVTKPSSLRRKDSPSATRRTPSKSTTTSLTGGRLMDERSSPGTSARVPSISPSTSEGPPSSAVRLGTTRGSRKPTDASPTAQQRSSTVKMASRGRVGLAGAPRYANNSRSSKADPEEDSTVSKDESTSDRDKENDLLHQDGEQTSEKVFRGFGSRPVGKIGVPVTKDEETGEMRAFAKDDLDEAGNSQG
ncbi:hypothetical protein OIO90_005041 [Microbotryomycetes sp. JL221]|nr:hypothetical protein OIO90_005041 [Microbotryomycetes sp. JL221]